MAKNFLLIVWTLLGPFCLMAGPQGQPPFNGNQLFEMVGMSIYDARMQQLKTYLSEDSEAEFSESLWFSRKKGLEIGLTSGKVERLFVHGRSPYNYGTQPFAGSYPLGIKHTDSEAAIVSLLGQPVERKSWGALQYFVEHKGIVYSVSIEINTEKVDVKHTYITLDNTGARANISTKDHGGVGIDVAGGIQQPIPQPKAGNGGTSGCVVGDCYAGMGTYIWDSGSKYIGEYKDGKRTGFGTYYFANGDTYVGEWKDNDRNGSGVYEYGAGVGRFKKYIGEWKEGKRTGVGLMYYQDGTKQFAEWKDDTFVKETQRMGQGCLSGDCTNGRSAYVWEDDGSYYMGNYSGGAKDGQGVYYYAKGGKYVGEFKNGLRHGNGTYYYPNGSRYEGQWKNDSRNGYGVLFRKGGDVLKTNWVNGNPAK